MTGKAFYFDARDILLNGAGGVVSAIVTLLECIEWTKQERDEARRERDEARAKLAAIALHFQHPEPGSDPWLTYLRDEILGAL